jgi:hypothetical protein
MNDRSLFDFKPDNRLEKVTGGWLSGSRMSGSGFRVSGRGVLGRLSILLLERSFY